MLLWGQDDLSILPPPLLLPPNLSPFSSPSSHLLPPTPQDPPSPRPSANQTKCFSFRFSNLSIQSFYQIGYVSQMATFSIINVVLDWVKYILESSAPFRFHWLNTRDGKYRLCCLNLVRPAQVIGHPVLVDFYRSNINDITRYELIFTDQKSMISSGMSWFFGQISMISIMLLIL